jgi:hypothetical protein
VWKGNQVGKKTQFLKVARNIQRAGEGAPGDQQPYDMAVKAMLKDDARQIIPILLPGATLLGVLDIEIIQSNLRADRAYSILYESKRNLVQLEIQSGVDKDMVARLLVYHTSLWFDYRCPITSIVIYLFRCNIPESPFCEKTKSKEILTFHFDVVCMWKQDARSYVKARVVSMYPLLPTMKYVDAPLLLQAIEDLIEYYQGKVAALEPRLLWMKIFLSRTTTVKKADKEQVMGRLNTFKDLFEQDEFVRQQRALGKAEGKMEGKAEGKMEGKAEGKVEGKVEALLDILKVRFPSLYEFAEARVTGVGNAEALGDVITFVVSASDEATARAFIETRLQL